MAEGLTAEGRNLRMVPAVLRILRELLALSVRSFVPQTIFRPSSVSEPIA